MFRGRSPASLPEQVARASVSAEKLNEAVNGCNQFTGTNRYDAAGNMIENGLYMYDAESRLSAAGGVSYTYDGDGLAESSVSGTLTAEYVFFHGRRIARRDAASGAIRYYFSDHLGSASVIANEAGTIVEESQYFPFGAERAVLNGDTNPYKFTGKECDSESGLDYFGARYYGSSMGRFTSADPKMISWKRMVDPQQWNMYQYGRNNPITMIDPDGREVKIATQELQKSFDHLMKSEKFRNAVAPYQGKGNPDLTIQRGKLGFDPMEPNCKDLGNTKTGPFHRFKTARQPRAARR